MNDTKTNGNVFKLKYINLFVLAGVVGIVLWLSSSFSAKADKTDVNVLTRDVMTMQLTLAKMNAKLDLLLDK